MNTVAQAWIDSGDLFGLAERPPRTRERSFAGGAVAQLGERLNGIQEVGGSTPLSSTNQIRRFRIIQFADSMRRYVAMLLLILPLLVGGGVTSCLAAVETLHAADCCSRQCPRSPAHNPDKCCSVGTVTQDGDVAPAPQLNYSGDQHRHGPAPRDIRRVEARASRGSYRRFVATPASRPLRSLFATNLNSQKMVEHPSLSSRSRLFAIFGGAWWKRIRAIEATLRIVSV